VPADLPRPTSPSPPTSPCQALLDDLRAEQVEVERLVADLPDEGWERPTPAAGWSVADQVRHLAWGDELGGLAALHPTAFEARRAAAEADPSTLLAGVADLEGAALLDRWRAHRLALASALAGLPADARLPWFGPDMGVRSFLTARLMETWAHGTDIADALGDRLPASDRLRHVAHLGVLTRGWSYRVRGSEPPDGEVHVALDPPGDGDPWTWGDPSAADRVAGPAEDFCLVVTQRRQLDAVDLDVVGPIARGWMARAQAFAGAATRTDPARAEVR
jgi:uncharacterized protein (TIGR03084 family)